MLEVSETLVLAACTVDLRRRRAKFADREEKLTSRDAEVLRYFAERAGEVVTREQLETEVWKLGARVRSEAVPVAIRRLRTRIERDPRDPEVLVTDFGKGWRLQLQEAPASAVPAVAPVVLGRSEVVEALREGWKVASLQTLVGPGGVGKTSLARSASPEGAIFVDLTAAQTRAECAEAIRHATPGLNLSRVPTDTVLEKLSERLAACPLVVLDNAEQALEPLRWLIRRLNGVRILVTSRERLSLPGERTILVPPLEGVHASELFVRRYREAGGQADLDADEVAQLVKQLDGIPLAIELVAPRARMIPLPELRLRLAEGLDAIPTSPGRDPRHANMRACMEWSWQSLPVPVQRTLCAAATFAGEFRLDALTQVMGESPFEDLECLLERSLVQSPRPGVFRVLLLIRSYARDQGIPPSFTEAHTRWSLGELAAIGQGLDRKALLEELAPELQRVLREATDPEDIISAATAIQEGLYVAGLPAAARDALDLAESRIEGPPDPRLQIASLHNVARLDPEGAVQLLRRIVPDTAEQQIELFDVQHYLSCHGIGEPPDPGLWRSALFSLESPPSFGLGTFALFRHDEGDREGAVEASALAVAQARRTGGRGLIRALRIHADVGVWKIGRHTAEQHLRESLALAEAIHFRSGVVVTRYTLAGLIAHRDRVVADEAFGQAAAGLAGLSAWPTRSKALCEQAVNAWFMGEGERSLSLFSNAEKERLAPSLQKYFEAFERAAAFQLGRGSRQAFLDALARLRADTIPPVPPGALCSLLEAFVLGESVDLEEVLRPLGDPPFSADVSSLVQALQAQGRGRVRP